MDQKIRVLLADDHKLVREGLKAFLLPYTNIEVVGEACDGLEAVDLARKLHPDVILLDLKMPNLDGIAATQQISQANPDARILIITSYAEDDKVVAAIRAGALGYLLKDSSPQELERAIMVVNQGESYLPPRIARKVIQELSHPVESTPMVEELTPRELEILRLVAQGLSNEEIASRLFLSAWTVRSHLGRIMRKLQVENRTQAALAAIRLGLSDSK